MEAVRTKPRLFFDTANHASHVTFDDAKDWRRNLPWMRYAGAHWSHGEPDTIRVEIGEWLVVVCGHNLGALFLAIEDQTLKRLNAHPELEHNRARETDTLATSIRFVRLTTVCPPAKGNRGGSFALEAVSIQY